MTDLAAHIARKIFECPSSSDPNDVQRIALKAGEYGNERDLGGLCEVALAAVVRKALTSYQANPQGLPK